MEKETKEDLSGMRIAESHIVPEEVDETNDLNSHDFYRNLANKYVMVRDKESFDELNYYIEKGSRLAVAYNDYINYALATQVIALYPTERKAESSQKSLSSALVVCIDSASKYSKCIEPVACMLAKTLLTKEEWDLYYSYLLPHVLGVNPNLNLIDLFNKVCLNSRIHFGTEKGLERITSRVLKLSKTQENPEELSGLVELSKQYIDIYCNHQKHTIISSVEVRPMVSPEITLKHKNHKNHQLDDSYLKIMAAGELSFLLHEEKSSDGEKKKDAQERLRRIREFQTYKNYDAKNPKDMGYMLKLMDTKAENLFKLARSHRDKKDPEYAVDCYSVAAGNLKDYKKAHDEIKKIKNSKNYKDCKESILSDKKIDFKNFQLEYFFAQRDYLIDLYVLNSDEKKQVQVQSQGTIQIQSNSQLVGNLKTMKQDLEREDASIRKNIKLMEKKLVLRRSELLAEKKEMQDKEEKLARLEEDAIENNTNRSVLEKEKLLLEKDILELCQELKSEPVTIDRKYSSGGGNESGEKSVVTILSPTPNVMKPIQREEKKTIKEPKLRKTLPVLARRNSTNSLIAPEKIGEEKKERRGLTRTQSVVEMKRPGNLGDIAEEKDKKDKKSRKSNNNSKNNANPNRALKLHQAEKKLVRKNSQQNLILNSEWESESELSVAEGDSKNLYVQEGKRDTDLKVLKKLLNDRDLILPSDVKLTDSKVRRILRDLAHRKVITWSGQRPESKDEKITATHHQNPDICLTIHLHGQWWANPAIKEHFMNFVRQCDAEIDSMMTEIENRKMKK